jgi:ABC-type lipoprotein release transport system permease subunit
MRELLDDSVAQRRLQTLLICVFAGTALLLAAFGIYGVVAYSVTRRRSEMGLRIALGARPADLYSLVVWHSMRPVVVGLLFGVPAALAAGQALTSLLYEVRPNHPAIVAGVPALLLSVALFACIIPARRATTVPPLETLRSE